MEDSSLVFWGRLNGLVPFDICSHFEFHFVYIRSIDMSRYWAFYSSKSNKVCEETRNRILSTAKLCALSFLLISASCERLNQAQSGSISSRLHRVGSLGSFGPSESKIMCWNRPGSVDLSARCYGHHQSWAASYRLQQSQPSCCSASSPFNFLKPRSSISERRVSLIKLSIGSHFYGRQALRQRNVIEFPIFYTWL